MSYKPTASAQTSVHIYRAPIVRAMDYAGLKSHDGEGYVTINADTISLVIHLPSYEAAVAIEDGFNKAAEIMDRIEAVTAGD